MGVGAGCPTCRYDKEQPDGTAAMTSERFDPVAAQRCDPYALARRGAELHGTVSAAELERLDDALVDEGGTIEWTARFSRTEIPGDRTRFWLDATGRGMLSLACSRCAEAVILPVAFDRRLRLVPDEALAAQLDEAADDHDVIAADSRFDLLATIEDELILALPAFPEHEQCPVMPAALRPFDRGRDDRPLDQAGHANQGSPGDGSPADGFLGESFPADGIPGDHSPGVHRPGNRSPADGLPRHRADDSPARAADDAGNVADPDRQFPFADLAAKMGKK